MAKNALAVKSVIDTINSDPQLSVATVRDDVILDIIKAKTKPEPTETSDEHDFGNPQAFTSGLISGNFPSW